MPNLEDRVVEWAQKELNKKIDKKDVASLLYSKNGHLYVKLFSLMVENLKSKSQCEDVASKLELIEEATKRDQLKSQLDLIKDQIAIKVSNIQKHREISEYSETKRQLINKQKIFLTLLSQVLEKIISFRNHFSKIPESTLHELQNMLIEDSISIKNLINEEKIEKQNKENISLSALIDQINNLIKEINQSLYELSNYAPLTAEKLNFDSAQIDLFLKQTCSSFKTEEKSLSTKENNSELNFGLSVLELVKLYEQKKLEQEDKLLIKLDKVSSMIQKLLDK